MTKPSIPFTKMHGLGNDFVIIDNTARKINIKQIPIQQLADRQLGIGFDQLLFLENTENADIFCRIFNADGSEAEQCGNGLRCIVRYLHEHHPHQTHFKIATKAGIFPALFIDNEHIQIVMGVPKVKEKLINLKLNPRELNVSILSVGNPHTILKMDSLENSDIAHLGHAISTHTFFPEGTNVGFMQIINPTHIRLRTFERGAGETHACGSNACAAACAGVVNGWLQSPVTVEFRYGKLHVEWNEKNQLITLTGPATTVFTGNVFMGGWS